MRLRWLTGGAVLVLAVAYLVVVFDAREVSAAVSELGRSLLGHPLLWLAAMSVYAGAFVLRTVAWTRVLPRLTRAESWSAIHVSLLGNHVLPLRLGETLRVTSVIRRTPRDRLGTADVAASVILLRSGDLLAVVVLAAISAPAMLQHLVGALAWVAAALLCGAAIAAYVWVQRRGRARAQIVAPDLMVFALTAFAWIAESAVMWAAVQAVGLQISFAAAVGVTAVTIIAQAVAVTPGGFGTYEAAATAALVTLGVPAGPALTAALSAHVVKTIYSVMVGLVALWLPAPSYFGPWRLPRSLPMRPSPLTDDDALPVVVVIPAYNEQDSILDVLDRMPPTVLDREVVMLVVDDGSEDDTAALARAHGAVVVEHPANRGLGAALRTGLAEAIAFGPSCVVYLDADGEYPPQEMERLVASVIRGEADYVVGSRFAGDIQKMHPHRRLGNQVLTVWVRWMTRRRDLTDGQSGYRAFSPRAAADAQIIHDYNYAQVLTLDLLGKGYRYAEVPISYHFRESGESFIRLGRYLRKVIPAVRRQLAVSAAPRSQVSPALAKSSLR